MRPLALASLALLLAAPAASAQATPLPLGSPVEGENAGDDDVDVLRVEVARRGPFALTFAHVGEPTGAGRLGVRVAREGADPAYKYVLPTETTDGLFFPVLEAGPHRLEVYRAEAAEPGPLRWRLGLAAHDPTLTDALRAAARAAEAKASAWLAARSEQPIEGNYYDAMQGLVLAACAEGADRARLRALDEGLVARLEERLEAREGTWRGQPVRSVSASVYEQAVVTLGLAEAAAHGSARARALLVPNVETLLAAQLTERRDATWGAVAPGDAGHGGWRYAFHSTDADISATGWCFVALSAANAAGVRVDGARDALAWASDYVRRCTGPSGGSFTYQPGSDEPGDVRDAIGALVLLLHGEEDEVLDRALEALDAHLSAWTQTDRGEGYPLYYAYYATRVHYLRGGRPWQVWRTTMLRQLLKNQTAEGTWPRFDDEASLGDDYSTSLGLMVLRMCLEQVPAYLKREVRGF